MSRPKRMTRWYVTVPGRLWAPSLRRWLTYAEAAQTRCAKTSHAPATTRRQAERIAARGGVAAVLTVRCSRRSKEWPNGFDRNYTWGKA